jgi:hypothetical protein
VLMRKYFQEAVALDPSDARYLGFLAGSTLAEGNIHKDEAITRQGYFTLLRAIDAWPEFNLFTAGYVMSRLPYDSERYRQALDWQWKNLDVCAGETVDRANPDYTKYMGAEASQKEGPKRVCWNSWIAPHNFEGFFLNFGDMLVKAGDWRTAQQFYANARLSHDYAKWPLNEVLEQRIRNAQTNVDRFRAAPDSPDATAIMIESRFSCMACHQQ